MMMLDLLAQAKDDNGLPWPWIIGIVVIIVGLGVVGVLAQFIQLWLQAFSAGPALPCPI